MPDRTPEPTPTQFAKQLANMDDRELVRQAYHKPQRFRDLAKAFAIKNEPAPAPAPVKTTKTTTKGKAQDAAHTNPKA